MTYLPRRPHRNAAASRPDFFTGLLTLVSSRGHRTAATLAIALATGLTSFGQFPSAEDGFAPSANAQVLASAVQTDGRIIIGGLFTELQGAIVAQPVARGRVARLNPDGSIDSTFNPNANGTVTAILVQPDGRILVGGYFSTLSPNGGAAVARNRIARLNTDGTLDTSFDPNVAGSIPSLAHVSSITLDSAGRILIGGEFSSVHPNGASSAVTRQRFARLNADGSVDASFSPSFNNVVTSASVQTDGSIIIAGGFTTVQSTGSSTAVTRRRIVKVSAGGVVDASYDPSANNLVTAISRQADGKLVVVGHFSTLQPNGGSALIPRNRMARLKSDGSLDESFSPGVNADADAVMVLADGRILVSGAFRAAFSNATTQGTRADYIARFNSDGTLDTSFFPGPSYTVRTFALQSDGKLFVGGYFTDFRPAAGTTSIVRRYMARLNPDGSVDASLNPSVDSGIVALAAQADGRILVGGRLSSLAGITRRGIARLSADGVVESGFDPGANDAVTSIVVQSDGRILVGGFFTEFQPNGASSPTARQFLARLNADGTLDTAFNPNPNGSVNAMAVQSDGKIVIGGTFTSLTPSGATAATLRSFIARLNSDGTVDTAFNPTADGPIAAIAIESGGKILIGGNFAALAPNGGQGVGRSFFARLNTDGTVDSGYTLGFNALVGAIRVLSDGKVLVGGSFTSVFPSGSTTPVTRNNLARVNSDGTVDTAFDPSPNAQVGTIVVQSDGKILLGGVFTRFSPNGATTPVTRNSLARINADGTVDSSFDPNPDNQVIAIVPQSSGNIVLAGSFSGFRPTGGTAVRINNGLARITSSGAVDVAFSPVVQSAVGDVRTLAYQADGTLALGGSFGNIAGSTAVNLIRVRSEGIVDPMFQANPNGAVEAVLARALVVDTTALNQRIGWLTSNGTLRSGLNIDPGLIIDGRVERLVRQSDGKILAAGSFAISGPMTGANLVRFNTDGSVDTSFNPLPNASVLDVAVQGDGRIVLVGGFTAVGGTVRSGVARINANGSVDTAFDPGSTGAVHAVAIQSDGRILVGGAFSQFNPNGVTTAISRNRMARLNADGTVDSAFNPNLNAQVDSIAIQADGKILAGGLFTSLQPNAATAATTRNRIARLNTDGTVDTAFDPNANGQVRVIRLQSDGKILAAGAFTTLQPTGATSATTRNRIARLNADGSLDTGFDPNVNSQVSTIAVQSDQSVVIGGAFTTVGGIVRNRLARVSASGQIDAGFNPNASSEVTTAIVLPDSSIVVGGTFNSLRTGGILLAGGAFTQIGGAPVRHLALLSTDGTPAPGAYPEPDATVFALARYQDGRVIAGGAFANVASTARAGLARFTATGTLETSFAPNPNGTVRTLAIQSDEKVVVGGTFTSIAGAGRTNFARLNSDGTIDAGFTANTDGEVRAVSLQADGKILVAGSFTTLAGAARTGIGRLNTDGSIDSTFNPNANGPVRTVAIQTDGSILIGGTFTTVGGVSRSGIAKLNANGSLDASYTATANGAVSALLVSPDGKVVVGGAFTRLADQARYLVGRLAASTLAVQSLEVGSDKTSLNWRRSGSGAEVSFASFEISLDSRQWTSIGSGSRDSGIPGWRLAGVTLPTNTLFFVRARAVVPNNQGASGSLVETVRAAFIPPSGSTGSSTEIPPRPENFLAETYLSANPDLANALAGLPDRLELAWIHYWLNGRLADPHSVFFSSTVGSSSQSRLINLSARSWIGLQEQALIMGVVVADGPVSVLVRALGPSLAAYGITNALPDPTLTVYSGNTVIASNNDWQAGSALIPGALQQVGASMSNTRDAAVVLTLNPGAYTFIVSDSSGGVGVGLGEIYLLNGGSGRLSNLSARAEVGEGGDILIAGFVRTGTGELLLRGVGPDLAQYGITRFLPDPILTLHSQQASTPILVNNDWGQSASAIADAIARAGAVPFPAGSKDAAAYVQLGAGAYTVHISGAAPGQKGVALVELFELP